MAEKVEDNLPVCVDAVRLSTLADCGNSDTVSSVEFSPEELYKHALQFYKGRRLISDTQLNEHLWTQV